MTAWDQLDRDPASEALAKWSNLEDFLATDPAATIIREAADRSRDAIVELLTCDPTDRAQIALLQARARVFHDLQDIVARVMDRGDEARHQMAQDRADDLI